MVAMQQKLILAMVVMLTDFLEEYTVMEGAAAQVLQGMAPHVYMNLMAMLQEQIQVPGARVVVLILLVVQADPEC